MNRIGILQGRLCPESVQKLQVFPLSAWEEECAWAESIGFDALELLVTKESLPSHPLLSDSGRSRLKELSRNHRLGFPSICGDLFKNRPFFRGPGAQQTESRNLLKRLIAAAAALRIQRILIPILEEASLRSELERAEFGAAVRKFLPDTEHHGIQLALETDLSAPEAKQLLKEVSHPLVTIYYDVGNAAALGRNPAQEIRFLGSAIAGVHIKDRLLGGPNVPLGTGRVNFSECFEALKEIGYEGPFVLETTPGKDPLSMARRHLDFVREQIGCMKSLH